MGTLGYLWPYARPPRNPSRPPRHRSENGTPPLPSFLLPGPLRSLRGQNCADPSPAAAAAASSARQVLGLGREAAEDDADDDAAGPHAPAPAGGGAGAGAGRAAARTLVRLLELRDVRLVVAGEPYMFSSGGPSPARGGRRMRSSKDPCRRVVETLK